MAKKAEGVTRAPAKKTAQKRNTKAEKKPAATKTPEPKKIGRPPSFTDAEELEIKIEAFFKFCDNNIYPYTIHGLCVAIGCTRDTLCEYEKKPEFSDTIKRAKEKIRWFVEKELFLGKNPSGMIFWLKNNADWKDKTEVEQKVDMKVSRIEIEVVKP